MSSEDELGELYGDSPAAVKQTNGRAAKSSQKPVAGPSQTKAAPRGAASGKRKTPREETEVAESDGKETGVDHIEISDTEASVQVTGNKGKGKAAPTKTNGHAAATEKGKGKVPPQRKTAKKTPARRISPVDEDVEMVDDAATEAPNKRPKTSDPDRAVQQLNKLQKELDSAIAERDALRQQLEEVHSVRYTEAEELVEQQKANHELQLKTCEQYIEELETRLARVDSHAQSGHTSSLRFITREAADEEKRSLEQEVSKWKDMAKRADQDKLDVLQSKKELEIELKAEIERSKTLAAGVPSAPKGRSNGAQHEFTPAQSQVLRFYEDLTNLLVTKHTREPSAVQGLPEESCYTCIYTHAETYIAINFTLRLYVEASEDSDELIEKVKYIPHDLDKESPAFREKLDYLKDPFIFERSQLHVFLWSLGETLKEKEQDEQENNADDNSGELVYPE